MWQTEQHKETKAEQEFSAFPPSQPQRSRGPKGQAAWHGPAAPPAAWPFLLLFPPPASVSGIACASVSQASLPSIALQHETETAALSKMPPELSHERLVTNNCCCFGCFGIQIQFLMLKYPDSTQSLVLCMNSQWLSA